MLHIYHGDGKGKTTAAMGLALRMLGCGKKVFIVQYLKGSPSGEVKSLICNPAVTILRGKLGTKAVFQMTEEERHEMKSLHMRQLDLAIKAAFRGRAHLVILDEALDAIQTGTLDEAVLVDAIKSCKDEIEIVLTGRNPSEKLLEIADCITYMKMEKHPYQQCVAAKEDFE